MEYFKKWHEAYSYIAEELLKYFTENPSNPAQSFYKKIKNSTFIKLNKGIIYQYDPKENPEGIDPVQIFVCFNYSKIKLETRVENINALLKIFGSNKEVSTKTNFEGIPAPIITQIKYNRKIEVQNELWDFFARAYSNKLNGVLQKDFTALVRWRGLQIPSLTMFLFWIDSNIFFPLDENTVEYLKNIGILKQRPKKHQDYIELCSKKENYRRLDTSIDHDNLIRNFVKEAYGFYEEQRNHVSISGTTQSMVYVETGKKDGETEINVNIDKQKKEQFKGFKIIAIRPLWKDKQKSIKQRHIKNLTEEKLYCLYNAFSFGSKDDLEIGYNELLDTDIYKINDVNISISAMVGMNGSGKSTIADLIYLIANRIAKEKKLGENKSLIKEEVFADLFIKSDKLYKISVGQKLEVFVYDLNKDRNKYIRQTKLSDGLKTFKSYDIEMFCYSLVVNYSLYGLNSKTTGPWINKLFHKNDAYQIPIVLNPMRNKGIVDVNKEDDLTKSRLLMNLLEPNINDIKNNKVPPLVPGAEPILLELKIDEKKISAKQRRYKKILSKNNIETVFNAFNIVPHKNVTHLAEAKEYIYLKVVGIAYTYKFYEDYKDLPNWIEDKDKLKEYTTELLNDPSHITFKLKQAINYIIYGLYKISKNNSIIKISKDIDRIIRREKTKELRTIDLIPPSFFQANVHFKNGGNLDNLSSGEKQQIYSINTIAYHLFNLKSVRRYEGNYKYNSINIIFDEVELYFHPDMQRTYIHNLRERIATLSLNKENDINNINIIFITHSPFILSDIPNENILKLEDGLPKEFNSSEQTFGANVYDLLTNEFFMKKGFIGEFSKRKINEAINFINYSKLIYEITKLKENKDGNNNHIKQKEKEAAELKLKISEISKEECKSIINLIGEPIIKNKLLEMYEGINDKDNRIVNLKNKIRLLQEEIGDLEKE